MQSIATLPELAGAIGSAIEESGAVRESASEEVRRARGRVRTIEGRLRGILKVCVHGFLCAEGAGVWLASGAAEAKAGKNSWVVFFFFFFRRPGRQGNAAPAVSAQPSNGAVALPLFASEGHPQQPQLQRRAAVARPAPICAAGVAPPPPLPLLHRGTRARSRSRAAGCAWRCRPPPTGRPRESCLAPAPAAAPGAPAKHTWRAGLLTVAGSLHSCCSPPLLLSLPCRPATPPSSPHGAQVCGAARGCAPEQRTSCRPGRAVRRGGGCAVAADGRRGRRAVRHPGQPRQGAPA